MALCNRKLDPQYPEVDSALQLKRKVGLSSIMVADTIRHISNSYLWQPRLNLTNINDK